MVLRFYRGESLKTIVKVKTFVTNQIYYYFFLSLCCCVCVCIASTDDPTDFEKILA